jgi:hypothetical protein
VRFDLQVSDIEVRNIPPSHFCFVEERFITERRVFEHAVPVTRNINIINVTQNITKYERVNNRIVNRSVDVEHIERVTGKTVQRYNITESNSARTTEIRGNQIVIHRPVGSERAAAARTAQERRVEQRHQQEQAQMEERHRREMEAAPSERRPEVAARHERERGAFEERWQRESAAQRRPRGETREQ